MIGSIGDMLMKIYARTRRDLATTFKFGSFNIAKIVYICFNWSSGAKMILLWSYLSNYICWFVLKFNSFCFYTNAFRLLSFMSWDSLKFYWSLLACVFLFLLSFYFRLWVIRLALSFLECLFFVLLPSLKLVYALLL